MEICAYIIMNVVIVVVCENNFSRNEIIRKYSSYSL